MSFGTSYAGLSGAGLGVPVGAPAPGSSYVRSADLVAARGLDLARKDYAVDDDETAVPHDDLDGLAQNVVLRLTTRKGRLPYDRTFGNDFLNLRRAPLDLQAAAARYAAEALSDLLASGDVRIVSVTADRSQGLALMTVVWLDARTSTERTAEAVATGT